MAKLPSLEARSGLSGPKSDTDVILAFQDLTKKPIPPKGKYAALVGRFRKGDVFVGRHGSAQHLRFSGKGGAENALIVGLGAAGELTEEKLRAAGGSTWAKLSAEKAKSVLVHADTLLASGAKGVNSELTHLRLVKAFAEGLIFPAYRFLKHKSKESGDSYAGPTRITFITQDKALKIKLDRELDRVEAEAEAMNVTRDWSNEPSNIGTPEYYAAEAKKLGDQYGLKVKILSEADALREKMGLFIGVGQGAEREGKIVIVEYAPKGVKNPKTVALVGKGVTFDSGGISIKPSMRMEDMKHDMTGAATVMGAIVLAARWKVQNRVVAVMAFTENMPSGNAIQPGNVLTSRNGKTVEIINTDAEGRLILADVLDYAQDMKPDAMIDVATLTGAVAVALGKYCCGILGNDDALIEAVRRAGDVNGERIWQLPLFDDYFDDLKSETADMKNSANDSYGGTIRGAIFLKQFIRKGVPWAHLDIATTSTNLAHLSYYPKRGANGSYVRTLAQFVSDFS